MQGDNTLPYLSPCSKEVWYMLERSPLAPGPDPGDVGGPGVGLGVMSVRRYDLTLFVTPFHIILVRENQN